MEERSGGWLCALALLWALRWAWTHQGEEVIYFRERGELNLQAWVGGNASALTWNHGPFPVAEWKKGALPATYYGGYQGRATLNTSSGGLLIRDAALHDGGEYTLQVDSVTRERRYVARLLPPLPTPLIGVEPPNCNHESNECVLVCGGVTEVTEVTEVGYSWRVGGGPWEKGGREMRIRNNQSSTQEAEEFTCRLENPLENKESRAKRNPFSRQSPEDERKDSGFDWRRLGMIGIYVAVAVMSIRVGYMVWRSRVTWRKMCGCAQAEQPPPPPLPPAVALGLLSASQGSADAPTNPRQL